MLIVAIVTATNPPDPDAGLTPPAIASITMIYLEASKFQPGRAWISTELTRSSDLQLFLGPRVL